MELVKKIQIFMEKYHMIKKNGRVLAGVSGGADSVCLLLILHELQEEMGFSLAAVHVEHGIRGVESLADAAFTEALCARLEIPFYRFSVDAPEYSARMHRSQEEAARELRYGCFARACAQTGADTVAVAHHANDSAETMLFHLARGTGIRGLGGISPVAEYRMSEAVGGAVGYAPAAEGSEITIVRPLLGVTRAEIEEYLHACGQSYCIDSTNADMAYARNRIRNRILPELCEVNAQAVTHMAKTAGQLREICDYLEEAAFCEGAEAYEVIYHKLPVRTEAPLIEKIRIFSGPFLAMHRVLQLTLVHYLIGVIAGSEKDVTSGHVEQVLALFDMCAGKRTDLPCGISARRTADGAELYHRAREGEPGGEADTCFDLSVPGAVFCGNGAVIRAKILEFDGNLEKIPKKTYTKWLDYDKIKGTVQLRTRRPGDYLLIDAQGAKKKLRRYFIDEKVSEEEREHTLLVAEESHVLWIIGRRISEAYKVTANTRHVLCLQYFTEENDGREN